jgi:hypothetical protein
VPLAVPFSAWIDNANNWQLLCVCMAWHGMARHALPLCPMLACLILSVLVCLHILAQLEHVRELWSWITLAWHQAL